VPRESIPSRSLGYKLGWTIALSIFVLVATCTFMLFQKKAEMLESRKSEVRHLVEAAYSVLVHFQQQEQLGHLSGEAARAQAVEVIRATRYGLSGAERSYGYYFINDDKLPFPTIILDTVLPALDGKSSQLPLFDDRATGMQMGLDGEMKPISAINLFAAFATVGNTAGEGFVTYFWQRPKSGGVASKGDPIYPKVSFVKKFQPWGWVIGSGAYVEDIDAVFWAQARHVALLVTLISIALGAISVLIARGISRPIAESARVMSEIEASGDLSRRMTVQGSLEATQISTAFNKMIASFFTVEQMRGMLALRNAALEEADRKTSRELSVARALQSAILPECFPPMPGCSGAARMLAATTMGGDFYDFIELPDGRIGLVMADVSGKGVPAAFFMAVARTTLRTLATDSSGPAECLRRTNDVLCLQNPLEMFVTVFYAVFDPATGEFTYANGGHNPTLLRRADGRIESLSAVCNLVLGGMPEEYAESSGRLYPGDSLVLYTDGVTEAFNGEGQMFGDERLHALVRQHGDGNAQTLVTQIFDSVIEFAGSAPQSDDITLAVLTWHSPTAHSTLG
jgi:serine phosphatase RsbU (regulator of sigma subunit)